MLNGKKRISFNKSQVLQAVGVLTMAHSLLFMAKGRVKLMRLLLLQLSLSPRI
jgi:hypothetical protein